MVTIWLGSSFINSTDDSDGVAVLSTALILTLMWLPKTETYVCSIMDKEGNSYSSIIPDEQGDSGILSVKGIEKNNKSIVQGTKMNKKNNTDFLRITLLLLLCFLGGME